MNDSIIYQNSEVMVTKSIVTIGGDTYSIRNINSVNISKEDTSKQLTTAISVLVGFVVLYFFTGGGKNIGSGVIVIAIILGGIFIKSILAIMNPQYFLVFSTSNGKTQALSAKSYNSLSPVKKAIEKAFS